MHDTATGEERYLSLTSQLSSLLSCKAVTIVEGKKSVDVKVELCYCNEELCNVDLSTGPGLDTSRFVTLLNILILTLVMK